MFHISRYNCAKFHYRWLLMVYVGGFLAGPHLWAAPKRPILNMVKTTILSCFPFFTFPSLIEIYCLGIKFQYIFITSIFFYFLKSKFLLNFHFFHSCQSDSSINNLSLVPRQRCILLLQQKRWERLSSRIPLAQQ